MKTLTREFLQNNLPPTKLFDGSVHCGPVGHTPSPVTVMCASVRHPLASFYQYQFQTNLGRKYQFTSAALAAISPQQGPGHKRTPERGSHIN